MTNTIPLCMVQRQVRKTACDHCPRRRPGCEDACPLFSSLPRLVEQVRCLDPMLAHYETAVAAIADSVNDPLARRFRPQLVAALRRYAVP